jgi:hypothetical protein
MLGENEPVRPLIVLAAALALTACSTGDRAWPGPDVEQTGGVLDLAGFRDYAEDVDESWERSPVLVAAEFLRLDSYDAPRTTIESDAGPEGGGPATVIVTRDLLDDSVRSSRYVLTLSRQDDVWRLDRAIRSHRCHRGRGHQDFTSENCV